MMSNIWYVRLFGGLRATRGDEVIERFRSQKFGALLAYLILHPERTHSREELAELFWPEADQEIGRSNLRTALSSLRRQLEPPGVPEGTVLQTQGKYHLRLGAGVTSDVAAFEAAINTARRTADLTERTRQWTLATEVYSGPLLPGHYDTWALNERDRLQEAYRTLLGNLATHWEKDGDLGQALDLARRAVTLDPLSEEANALVIRLLVTVGQNGAAQRQFDDFKRRLQEELGIHPSVKTQALLTSAPVAAPRVERNAVASVPYSSIPPSMIPQQLGQPVPIVPPKVSIPATPSPTPLLLPSTVTHFFGREEELAALAARLPHARLITITGPGGSGKTRFAIEAARFLVEHFKGGVYFTSLVEATDAVGIITAIAEVLALPRLPEGHTVDQIVGALPRQKGQTLLLLDNFEHLLKVDSPPTEDCVAAVETLLSRVPTLTILVTSRQRLLLTEEREFPLLPLPTPSFPGSPERLLEFASVQLFVHRAQSVRSDFQLNARNAAAVAALCTRLEGIPLAIELAAGWAGLLTPAQMLERIERRFDLLVARRRDISPRHRSLRAAIESSYQMLPPPLQQFFARLSVFHKGWTLDAAEFVTEDRNALAHLTTLTDHSLLTVQADEESEGLRFGMLETLRVFAAEQLDDSSRIQTTKRHATYFLHFAEGVEPELRGPQQNRYLTHLEQEQANFEAALAWAKTTTETLDVGLRLGASLWRFWMLRGYLKEGRRHLQEILARTPSDSPLETLRALVLHGAGSLARLQGDTANARNLLQEALTFFQKNEDKNRIAMCLHNLAIVNHDAGDYTAARDGYEQSLALRRIIGDQEGIANTLNSLGVLAFDLDDSITARRWLEESMATRLAMGQEPRAPQLINLGEIARQQGDYDAAGTWYEKAVAVARQAGNKQALATGLGGQAIVAGHRKDQDRAHLHFSEAFGLFQELGDVGSIAQTLEYCAIVMVEHVAVSTFSPASIVPIYVWVTRLWGAAATFRETTAIPMPPTERPAYEQAMARVTGVLDAATFNHAWQNGQLLTPEQAVHEATNFPTT